MADIPGVCKTSGCAKEGQPLEECDCVDGEHGGVSGVDENFPSEAEKEE